MSTAKLVIKTHTPTRTRMLWILAVVLIASTGYGFFEYGRYKGGFDVIDAARQREAAEDTISQLEKQNADLRQHVALLETSQEIDSEAYVQVERNLTDLQARIQQQEEDLAFYRGIVSPADNVSGLRIQEFLVTKGSQSSLFRFKIVLVQAIKHDRRVSGVVNLSVDGALNGQPVSFALAELTPSDEGGGDVAYSFRYFQNFEHDVVLPAGFTPDRVNIEVRPSGRSARTIRQSYDWSVKSS